MKNSFHHLVVLLLAISCGASLPSTIRSASSGTSNINKLTALSGKQRLPTFTTSRSAVHIRGGAFSAVSRMDKVGEALQSGPFGVLALTCVAGAVVIPLTLFRQAYAFSVGYGYSVFAMALAVFLQFDAINNMMVLTLSSAVMFYGLRLGTFLLIREWTVPSKAKQLKDFDKSPTLNRIPFALSVSIFYAFMTCPLMYVARVGEFSTGTLDLFVTQAGISLAWFGALLEAITDGQKFMAKRGVKDENKFVGPTQGFYRLCRHPNYFGELLFWFGLALAGLPSFGKNAVAWICTSLGILGIFSIMKNATKRLDAKQKEKYSGQKVYKEYRKNVRASLWPGIDTK